MNRKKTILLAVLGLAVAVLAVQRVHQRVSRPVTPNELVSGFAERLAGEAADLAPDSTVFLLQAEPIDASAAADNQRVLDGFRDRAQALGLRVAGHREWAVDPQADAPVAPAKELHDIVASHPDLGCLVVLGGPPARGWRTGAARDIALLCTIPHRGYPIAAMRANHDFDRAVVRRDAPLSDAPLGFDRFHEVTP